MFAFSELYILYSSHLRALCIMFLLFINACDCTNPNQGLSTVADKHQGNEKVIQNVVMMRVVPNKLKGDEREIKINFTLLNGFTELLLKKCRLKITCSNSNPAGTNINSYLTYLNDRLIECRETSVNMELKYFQLIPLAEQDKALTLNMALVPDMEVEQLEINFELFDEKGNPLQNDQAVWERGEGNFYKLKLDPHRENKLIEECDEQKEFTIKINNMGSDITEADQLKLTITRIDGKDAILSIFGQNNQIQELDLGQLANNASISKDFIIQSIIDKRAKFLFRLLCKGKEQDFLYVDWEKIIPSIQLQYFRKDNQLRYSIFDYKALQTDSLELTYENLSNNRVSIGGAIKQSISLSRSYDYSSLPVYFNNEIDATFKFKLLYKGKPVSSETIILKNCRLKIVGIGARQDMHGKNSTDFYVKNVSGVPVNIGQLYIQCTSMNGVSFTLQNKNGHTDDVGLKSKLSDFIKKETLSTEEQIPITIQLKDTNNRNNLDFNLQIYDGSDGNAILLDERNVILVQN